MVGIDTIKILLPITTLKGVDFGAFDEEIVRSHKGVEVQNKSYSAKLDYGLNRIEVDNLNCNVVIDASAKILKDNYKHSISLNTLTQFTSEINKHNLIEVDEDALLASTVLKCDPVDTVEVSDIENTVASVVQYANMNRSYDVGYYRVKGSLGYSVKRKVKSYKERQIGYSKLHDLMKDKYNRDFCKEYPNMVRTFARNDLRVECNIVAAKQMRKHFSVTNNTLGAILNSTQKVNHSIFNRVIDTGVQMDLFSDTFSKMDLPNLVRYFGYNEIFKMFDWDWKAIESWIKMKYPRTKTRNSAYYQIKQFKKAYSRLAEQDTSTNSAVNQLVELLKAA